jgi:hypothetical protein
MTKKPKLIVLPEINDIEHFKSGGIDKANNGAYNEIRENIITNMYNLDDEYLNDINYGNDWKNIFEKFNNVVSPLCELPYKKITIKHMGGMTYNYDFLVSFIDEIKKIVKDLKLEFKHNNKDVTKLVQFLEIFDKDCKEKFELCTQMSYAEFYYDNYLDKYLDADDELICEKPEKQEYLKYVSDIKYKHNFFKLLYSKKNNEVKKKKEIANESVREYLKLYSSTFNFNKITEKIKESQTGKVFLLWDCENFHTQILDIENISISGIKKIDDLSFTVNVLGFEYDICIRLRWANNNGLANPSWKFSFISK